MSCAISFGEKKKKIKFLVSWNIVIALIMKSKSWARCWEVLQFRHLFFHFFCFPFPGPNPAQYKVASMSSCDSWDKAFAELLLVGFWRAGKSHWNKELRCISYCLIKLELWKSLFYMQKVCPHHIRQNHGWLWAMLGQVVQSVEK